MTEAIVILRNLLNGIKFNFVRVHLISQRLSLFVEFFAYVLSSSIEIYADRGQ